MKHPLIATLGLVLCAALPAAPVGAQTKLKFAHVYETTEPFHRWALWAAEEVKKRTAGRYEMQVFPASSLGKETDINQGLTLGTIDIIYTGQLFAARTYPALAIGDTAMCTIETIAGRPLPFFNAHVTASTNKEPHVS